jgi:hypothetical protein
MDRTTIDFTGAGISANLAGGQVGGRSTGGVYLEDSDKFAIQQCTFSDHSGSALVGVGLRCLLVACDITENTFSANQTGVHLSEASARIQENQFNSNSFAQLRLQDVQSVTVEHNQFNAQGTSLFGIWLDKSDYPEVQIRHNNFVGHAGVPRWAIAVMAPSFGSLGGWIFVDAEQNWWNHAAGPDDAPPFCLDGDCNVNAGADRSDNAVDYRPWGTSPY